MSTSGLHFDDTYNLTYVINHVFFPLQLPNEDDHSVPNDCSLVETIAMVARLYNQTSADVPPLRGICQMLDGLQTTVQFQSLDNSRTMSQLRNMNIGDVLAFPIRAQNVAVVFRKRRDATVFEAFEASPPAENVMAAQGKLICSYPGPAIDIPNNVFNDRNFLVELVNFLVCMNEDVIPDAAPMTRKAQSLVAESRDTTHPRYITELLTGILRSVGRPAEIGRISKRVGDEVVWRNSKLPWRRSPLWLLIRVVLQTTMEQSSLGCVAYKKFMLFFLCCLGKARICANLPNHLLQCMSTKISQRLRKLGSFAPDSLSQLVLETCTSLRSIMGKRWAHVQAIHRISAPWTPSQLHLPQDIQLSLSNSKDYLQHCLAYRSMDHSSVAFRPQHRPRGKLVDFLSPNGMFFEEAYRAEPYVTLYDVEQAVGGELDGWVDRVRDNNQACEMLVILGRKYSSSALKTYGNNPELLSIMLLTTIELWIALDQIAIRDIPILLHYSPEVPTSLLEGLLLCKAASLERLRRAHQHLSLRRTQAHRGSVFSTGVTADTFAVRYYKDSPELQSLKARIEAVAQCEVNDKIAELEKLNALYAQLGQEAASIGHTFTNDQDDNRQHSKACEKCDLEKRQKMEIAVHEWPLPADELYAMVVVFELDCPVSFNMWRTCTFDLLVDLCSTCHLACINPYIELGEYSALKPYLVKHARSRVTLASNAKPFINSHYRTTTIPTSISSVCVTNGLKYFGFDSRAKIAVSSLLDQLDVQKYCTYQLERGPYQNLQKYVDTTSHMSNEILANQADCDKDLSIHEYSAFGHLRSGGMLQWLNVLRELWSRTLSFRRHEVHLLFAQVASQVGPLGDTGWTWHQEMQDPSFCHALLAEMKSVIQDVEANWLEGVTMDTISFLLRRLLASSPNRPVSLKAVKLLRIVRAKVFHWLTELSARLTRSPEEKEFSGFLRDNAAICRSTFDVDSAMIHELLSSAEDVDVLISSAILIHDHMPGNISCLPAYSQLLLDRDRRLPLALANVFHGIPSDTINRGFDRAISRFWHDYRPGSKWVSLQYPNSCWFSCMTAATTRQCSQAVHFNTRDGSLLVNGKPLGRLPTQIMRHPLYNLIFGERVFDVIPSDIPGMDYSTRGPVFDHQVYFCLRNDSDLVIQAKSKHASIDDSGIMELIPQQKLEGDLPTVLIEGHAHWLNLSTSIMEVRPLDGIWKSSPANWTMDCALGEYRMRKGQEFLVDIRSPSWAMVSDVLKPLDTPRNLIVSVFLNHSESPRPPFLQLTVVLPRYGLSFYVDDDGDLQSHDIRGMVYDESQCVGTLFGLVNRLVLRPKIINADAADLISRCVLIPEGRVSFRKVDHHVSIEVIIERQAQVTFQTYRVDTDLGCLTTSGLTNKLYCAYLHALTSGCDIDPLTGRSGTEEALSLLWSSGCWSAMKISSRDAELLGLIASLCPARVWYPAHLQRMQQVAWLDLPATSQHHELYTVTKAMKAHYERLMSFHESHSDQLFVGFPDREDHLLERSARRATHLFPSGFSSQPSHSDCPDVRYVARDLVEDNSGEQRAYTAATVVYRRTVNAVITKDILGMVQSWSDVTSGDTTLSLRYDMSWLTPKLPLTWIKVYNLLRTGDEGKWYLILFSLPAMAYASPHLSDLVPVLVAFASHPRFRPESPPSYTSYNLTNRYEPLRDVLHGHFAASAHELHRSPEKNAPKRDNETSRQLKQRRLKLYRDRLKLDGNAVIDHLLGAWPCETLPNCPLNGKLYDTRIFTSKAESYFSSCYHNLKLKEHLIRVQQILNDVPVSSLPSTEYTSQYTFRSSPSIPRNFSWMLTLNQVFSRPQPSLREPDRLPRHVGDGNTPLFGLDPLRQLISTFEASAVNRFQHRYASALRTSAESFGSETTLVSRGMTDLPDVECLMTHYKHCKSNYVESLHLIRHHLGPKGQNEQALEKSGQWPRLTPHILLRLIASNSPLAISDEWKRCLIQLALLALELQRSRRLLRLYLDHHHEELRKELQNDGCDGWSAEMHPDWLLIQLQGDFFVRRVQAEVANEMISPRSGENTAMQLNMGEGKSSVIVPIVITVLADGNQLVRVVVPKTLTAQMFHLLVKRLGGLVHRRIYFLPFSRSLRVTPQKVAVLREIMFECMREHGVLVVQPEHILSLKLLSVEKQLPPPPGEQMEERVPLLELQRWLHSHSRDILDESDEILHVRYQLVYTIGNQQHVEGFPERWTTTQQILSLVKKHVPSLLTRFMHGIEYEPETPGAFPRLRILHADAGQELVSCILEDVNNWLPNFGLTQVRSDIKDAIRSFISCEHVSNEIVQLVKAYSQGSTLWGGLLLLRGLLAMGILVFAFRERRWRVDYGLALARTMLAVPYRAKDVPAQRAEFGHPEVTIILTCLSYYYGGLTEGQLRISFDILLKQDDPSVDYDMWVRECPAVPEALQTLNGINIKSSAQWSEYLIPLFSRNKATVDFYLSRVVFPKEAKEFPSKLSCSGWDLAEKRERVVTGFSGTNDGQYLLPLHITQRDPDHQRGTNAKVLSYLLQPENNHYMCMARKNGERRTTRQFLETLVCQRPEIRVLLDVGAQMLELENSELAQTWLDISPDVSAAIYFNEDDELTVYTRDGRTELLSSSPFEQQLDQCVIYLDDAHTRGTDMKFPKGFRAAVTLGPKVTKDRLAQGCMRMRKLGHGHSVMFFAPLEIDHRIRTVGAKEPQDVIDTVDILHWAIRETCNDIHHRAPHWIAQGVDHTSRYDAWVDFCGHKSIAEELSGKWLQPEAKSLEELYGPESASHRSVVITSRIRQWCEELGILSLQNARMDEEQERELIQETERERQVERPMRLLPEKHSIHNDVVAFVKTGVVPTSSKAFQPAFETLAPTSAASDEAHVWSPYVLTTRDFKSTVQTSGNMDDYLRPVHWIASGKMGRQDLLVILSPYEVNCLLPAIRSSNYVHLHVYTPRVTRSIQPCDDLTLYNVPAVPPGWRAPSHFMDQLNVFAGQLYLKDYESYIRLCRLLCLYARDLDLDIEIGYNGFIAPENRQKDLQGSHTFQSAPSPSLRRLMALRRKGMGFTLTHMGKLLDGRLLSEDDFKDCDGAGHVI